MDDDLYRELRAKAMDHLTSTALPQSEPERGQTLLGTGHGWALLTLAEAIRLDTTSRTP